MDKPWKVVFAFVGVFIAGAVFGGLFTLRASGGRRIDNLGRPDRPQTAGFGQGLGPGQMPGSGPGQRPGQKQLQPPAGIGPAMMRQLNQRLKLTEEQREKTRPVVVRAAEDLQRLSRENLQNTTRVVERMHLDIAAWLTPEQRVLLEEMKMQMRERLRKEGELRGEFSSRKIQPGAIPPGQNRVNGNPGGNPPPNPPGPNQPPPPSGP